MLRRTISLATRTEPVWLPLPSNVRRKRSLPRRSATAKVVAIPSSSSSYSSSSTEDNQKRRSDHRRSSKNEFTVWNDPEDHALFAFRWKRLLDAHEQKAGKRKDEADNSSRRLLSPHEVESILCEDPKLSGATARWVPMLLAEKPAQLSLSSPTSSSSSASEEVSAVSMMDELRKRLDEQDQMRRARSQSLTAPQSPQERDFVDMVLENLELPKGSVWFTCFVHAQLLSSVKGPRRHHQPLHPPSPPHTPARKRRSADASLHHTTATAPTRYGALHADAVDDGESSSANDASSPSSHFSHRKPSPSIVVLATIALPDPKVTGVERTTSLSSSSDSSFDSSAQQEKGSSSPTTKKSKKTKANKKKREETSTTTKAVPPAQKQDDDAFRIEIGLFDSTMTISDAAKSPLFGDERR